MKKILLNPTSRASRTKIIRQPNQINPRYSGSDNPSGIAASHYLPDQLELYDVQTESKNFDHLSQLHKHGSSSADTRDPQRGFDNNIYQNVNSNIIHGEPIQSNIIHQQQQQQYYSQSQQQSSQSPSQRILKMKITSSYVINQPNSNATSKNSMKYVPYTNHNSDDHWNERKNASTGASTRKKDAFQPGMFAIVDDLSSTMKQLQKEQIQQLHESHNEILSGINSYISTRAVSKDISSMQMPSYAASTTTSSKTHQLSTSRCREGSGALKTGRMVQLKHIVDDPEMNNNKNNSSGLDGYNSSEQWQSRADARGNPTRKTSIPSVLSSALRKGEYASESQRKANMKSRDPTPPQPTRRNPDSQISNTTGVTTTKKSFIYLQKSSPLQSLLGKGVKVSVPVAEADVSNSVEQITTQDNFEEMHFLQVDFHQKCKHWMKQLENNKAIG